MMHVRTALMLKGLKVKWYKPASPTTASDWPDGLQAQSASGRSARMVALIPAVAGSQIRTVWSQLAVASQAPSGAIATRPTYGRSHRPTGDGASTPA